MFSVGFKATPQGWDNLLKMIGFNMLTAKSIANRLPQGDSNELSPRGPLSVKKRRLFFSDNTMLFGPLSAWPSKSLMTGVISILFSVTVWDKIA